MVTFTCNNCGDSVKKNRVEKHYSVECRRKSCGPNVCCIDCLKDFRQDYEAHTACKTEDERYAAKGTFVSKDPKNKQKNKQMSWSEIIQSIADSTEMMQPAKDILNIIKESDNVPRKEAKFKNFCMNNANLRRFRQNDIMDVFNLIQEEMKKNTEAAKLEKEQTAAKNECSEILPDEISAAKKRSIDNTEDMNADVPNKKGKADESSSVGNEEKSKQKKNKTNGHNKSEEIIQNNGKIKKISKLVDPSLGAIQIIAPNESGKTKKKKKNKADLSVCANKIKIAPHERDEKVNGCQANGTDTTKDESSTNGHINSKKKKNKKHSKTDNATLEVKEDDDIKSPKKKKKSLALEKTSFKEIIAKLLKPGTEFKLKSLKKMVFAVYKSGEEEVPREVRENFNKKLSKIPNVQINEKLVKMLK